MKALVRALTDRGLVRFGAWLASGASGDAPSDLLSDPETSEPVIGSGVVETCYFPNRYELAIHVLDALYGCDFNRLSFHKGLWGWLSLFYFDLLCPKDLTGARKVLAVQRYLFDPEFRRASSHLVREAVVAVRNHGQFARALLISPKGGIKDTKVLSELSSRQDLISNQSVVELAWLLYFDQKRGALRNGTASAKRPGSVQRFALVLQQLSLNYDLPAMRAPDIAGLLPSEFEAWKKKARLGREQKPVVLREAARSSALASEAAKAHVTFDGIAVGTDWEREQLAARWGYRTFHALARGVFTPAGENKIVLFVTEAKQQELTRYSDQLRGKMLTWEGETGHSNDLRIAEADQKGDEIHVFYRERHHIAFRYLGRVRVKEAKLLTEKPSQFIFEFE